MSKVLEKLLSVQDYEKYILTHFRYNSDGTLSRDDRKGSNGSYDKDGYLIVKVKGKQFKAHRIVWLLHHGVLPNGELDHKNRNRSDNRIENLREATRKMQVENRTVIPNPDTGVVGVHIDRTKGLKKRYAFYAGGRTHRFYTVEEAITAKNKMKEEEAHGAERTV